MFATDLVKRKSILVELARKNPKWKQYMKTVWFLRILAIVVAALIILLSALYDSVPVSHYSMIVIAIITASMPLAASFALHKTAVLECSEPYSKVFGDVLLVKVEGVEYDFWSLDKYDRVRKDEDILLLPKDKHCTYTIPIADIESVNIEDNVCTIQGHGTIRKKGEGADAKWADVDTDSFSFLMDFEKEGAAERLIECNRPVRGDTR
jgi:hypothetical protein